jgi:predicted transcriptional regulator
MDIINKQIYNSLIFLSKYSTLEILNLMKEDKENFDKKVPKDVLSSLQHLGYIKFQENANTIITTKGLNHMRELKDSILKERAWYVSLIAIVISILSIIISYAALTSIPVLP